MLIEGISIQVNGSVQDAIDIASVSYLRKFGKPPTHVSLPGWCDSNALNLYTLKKARPTSAGKTQSGHAGTVVVGRVI